VHVCHHDLGTERRQLLGALIGAEDERSNRELSRAELSHDVIARRARPSARANDEELRTGVVVHFQPSYVVSDRRSRKDSVSAPPAVALVLVLVLVLVPVLALVLTRLALAGKDEGGPQAHERTPFAQAVGRQVWLIYISQMAPSSRALADLRRAEAV
jgi:hypothetical protein